MPICTIDSNVLNDKTVGNLTDMGLSIFAPLCGRNRGAFVTTPPDGHTYSCQSFPDKWTELVGADINVTDSNVIKDGLVNGTLAPQAAVDLIDLVTMAVYQSSANVAKTPYGCDVAGLATLKCNQTTSVLGEEPIRAVTLAGLFAPARWATGGHVLSVAEAKAFYTSQDFEDMKEAGLNTVFIQLDGFTVEDEELLEHVLDGAGAAGLKAIISVGKNDLADLLLYSSEKDSVLGVVLPDLMASTMASARNIVPTMPLFLPANGGDLDTLNATDPYTFAALDMSRTSVVADVASSTSLDDRMKLFYHEATSCIQRSPIEYAECYRKTPVFVASGFDLSIDDCATKGTTNKTFEDFGQCDRFSETISSNWWHEHRKSLAARQLFAFEQGAGWTFSTWKLYNDDVSEVIESPAQLMALKSVLQAGLFPSLHKSHPAKLACLNPPMTDFVLGDETLSPTAGPPPDCGDGWWNYSINDCTFWVPPTTPAPAPGPPRTSTLFELLGGGILAGFIVGMALYHLVSGNKRSGYESVPSN